MDSFLDDLLNDRDAYSHVQLDVAFEDKGKNSNNNDDSAERKIEKRPLSNREAVRKYREKKKARVASVEDEVLKLRASNQQLLNRLKDQSALEAEFARLKCLLVDIRGRIEGEIGSFPYQKSHRCPDSLQENADLGS